MVRRSGVCRGELLAALVVVAVVAGTASCFYLPGVAPKDYLLGDDVELKVNKLVSSKTQIPLDYYSLPFCKPTKVRKAMENLGEILLGDKIENSLYRIKALTSSDCEVLCPPRNTTKKELEEFEKRIRQDYRVNWIVDNLPAATKKTLVDFSGKKSKIYEGGFPLGVVQGNNVYLNNHVKLKLLYHPEGGVDTDGKSGTVRIVGFEVEPQSILHSAFDAKGGGVPQTCTRPEQLLSVSNPPDFMEIVWTYSVEWELNSEVRWSSRWDVYLQMTDTQIHWFSIINSLLIVLFLTGMVAMIMMRTLHAEIRKLQEMESQEEAQEETGWKLVHGDVLRPPKNRMLLAVCVGSGIQVLAMAVIALVFALLGFLSPANRGGLITAVVVLYICMALFAGYFSARAYKLMKGTDWKKNTIVTATLFPSVIFLIFFFLNIVLAAEDSSGYVHFGILVGIFVMWFGLSIPLAFFGSYLGFKKPLPEPPVRTNQIPRQIPEQVWYIRAPAAILMGGILPFGAVFIELFFILSSIWQHQFYYMFGFLFIVFIILILTCAEITIVMCYFQLCSEDYRWWWRSFLTSGACAFYMFLYAVFYFFEKLQIEGFASTLLYFGYTAIMTLMFFLFTGSIGFYSCHYFIRTIYGSVKVS